MDVDKIMEEIMILVTMNNQYLQQMMSINSQIKVDDINSDTTINRNSELTFTDNDITAITNNFKNISLLEKKIADNIATINNLSAQIQLSANYFDDLISLAKYNGSFVSNNIPEVMQGDISFLIIANFKNIGFSYWGSSNITLELTITSLDINDNYSNVYTVGIVGADIEVGQTTAFEYSIQTPSIPGTYSIVGRLKNNSSYFGDSFDNLVYIG